MGIFDFFRKKRDIEHQSNCPAQPSINDDKPRAFKIVQILSHGMHGYDKAQSLLVLANDIKLGHREVCDETCSFLLPQSEWNHIVSISNRRGTWVPDYSEFSKERIYFKGLENKRYEANRIVWRHRLVPGANGMTNINPFDINEISNWEYKISALKNQYYSSGWISVYPSFALYVLSLAQGDDVENFWGWLFDDNILSNCDFSSLPTRYKALFKTFLQHCN